MITPRGFGFLFIVLLLLALSLWINLPAIALLCLTLLVWFLGTWVVFAAQVRLHLGRLRFTREVRDERGAVESLWAGRTFSVRIAVATDGLVPTPYLRATDRVPFGLVQRGGDSTRDGSIDPEEPLEFVYQITCLAPGKLRFEGVRVQLADLQGFFGYTVFLHQPREYRVLPAFADLRGRYPTVKRLNL